jgi:hypothetical protein
MRYTHQRNRPQPAADTDEVEQPEHFRGMLLANRV